MQSFIMGLDQGTTGTTAILFDRHLSVLQKAYREHQQFFPNPGWVEHNPVEVFENSVAVIRELLQRSKIQADQIAGLGITNQRETVIAWDKTNSRPYYPAIVWQCRRTSQVCEKLKGDVSLIQQIYHQTGLPMDPYFSATKIQWLFDNALSGIEPSRIAIGTIDSWLLWNFTQGKAHSTDFTNASRTMLFDIHQREWSTSLLELFKIPADVLTQVFPSQHFFGEIHEKFFGHRIPIFALAGDQQASLFGHVGQQKMHAKCTLGTGAFALMNVGSAPIQSRHQLVTTLGCSDSVPDYLIEGSVFACGSVIQWLKDQLHLIDKASQMDELANQLLDNEGVFMVPAFVGLGAPHWDFHARAAIVGMHLGTDKRHFARAALESIAYQVFDLIEAMGNDTGQRPPHLAIDGGVSQSRFLVQFLSNLLQTPILTTDMIETTVFGVAKMAALYAGWDVYKIVPHYQEVKPSRDRSQVEPWLRGWQDALSRVKK